MSQPMTVAPRRSNPYASAGKVVVSAVIVALLVVFAVGRFSRPGPQLAGVAGTTDPNTLVAVDPRSGLTTTFVNIGKSADTSAPATNAQTASAAPPAAGNPPATASGASAVAGATGTPGSDHSFTGAAHADDVVMARQLLMDGNETAMGPIDMAAGGADVPLQSLKDDAYMIYTYLSVAPHLFPPETKPVTAADGTITPSTAAAASIWDNFEAFYGQFMDAANVAYDASQATDIDKFRDLAKQLRTDCDACHAKNMHVFDPTTGK